MVTLVAVPGIMSDARTWASVTEGLKSHFSAVYVADTTQDATLEAMAARALAETEGDIVILSHSMGGRVAMEMGRQAPGRVKGMVLASTGHKAANEAEPAHREARIAEANADMKTYAENWVPKVVSPENAKDPELVARIRAMVLDCPKEVHERQNRALVTRPDASAYLPQFGFPVLLITGAEDKLSTEAAHAEIAALIPDAQSLVIDGSGHLLPFERPAEVLETVKSWMEEKGLIQA